MKVPESIPGVQRLDAEGVIELANRIPDLVVIDARIATDRQQGYIEGSVSLPDVATTCDSLGALVTDHERPVLFYCNGVECGRSVVSVRIAQRCGYRNLYWFRGGFEEWLEKGYPYLTD